MNKKQEQWIIINDFPNYAVSNTGLIKRIETNKLIKLQFNKPHRYLQCNIYNGKIVKTFKIHKLVAENFLIKPIGAECINHIDGNKENNNVLNLEWCTNSHNLQHAYNNKLKKKYQFAIYQISLDGQKIVNEFESSLDAERKTGINASNIRKACNGEFLTMNSFQWRYKDK